MIDGSRIKLKEPKILFDSLIILNCENGLQDNTGKALYS